MIDIAAILNDWNNCITNLETVISQRQIEQFKKLHHNAEQYFKQIQLFIDQNDKDHLKEFSEQIRQTSDRWREIAEKLAPWMLEIKQQLEAAKQNKKQRQKVGKIFSKPSKAGSNLNVKAR